MPTTRAQATTYAEVRRAHHHNDCEPVASLPLQLLEAILIHGRSTKDKKALRQTCKIFQQTLDSCMKYMRLKELEIGQHKCLKRLFKRTQNLRAASVQANDTVRELIEILPGHLAALVVYCHEVNLEQLKRLTCLTSLCLNGDKITGMECVSGLTHLECYKGSVAQLAPTLKHLTIWDCNGVSGTGDLTNLEILQIHGRIPIDFFSTHRQLPLKTMYMDLDYCKNFISNAQAWQLAPPTLTRLTLEGPLALHGVVLPALPTTITHLQLLYVEDRDVEQAAAILPGLIFFDLYLKNRGALDSLRKLTKLQSLGLLVETDAKLQTEQAISKLPRVVQVHVFKCLDEMLGMLRDPFYLTSAWGMHA